MKTAASSLSARPSAHRAISAGFLSLDKDSRNTGSTPKSTALSWFIA
ncbi:hypothetical protein [Streptomyces sp. NPDC048489]